MSKSLGGLVLRCVLAASSISTFSRPALADACPKSFQGKTADDLTNCVKDIQDRLTVLEGSVKKIIDQGEKSKPEIISAGAVDENGTLKEWPGSKVHVVLEAPSQQIGQYKVVFTPNLEVDPMVLVGAGRAGSLVSAAVRAYNRVDFVVETNDAHGGVWSGFWYVVLGP
jgi:hypothetical protein